MKKIFIAMMAMAAFAACATEDTIVTPKGQAIAFGDAFVDNATKAIYENGAVPTEFKVWGNVAGKVAQGEEQNFVALYGEDGATVTGSGVNKVYTCNVVRYWTPSCNFNFAAIVNGLAKTVENGLPTLISYTANGDDDLLYAAATAETNASGAPSGTIATVSDKSVVAFTFKHLLSRVAVKFTNKSASADYTYTVKDIQISNAYASGDYTIASETWSGTGAMTTPLTFSAITTAIAQNATVAATGAYVIIPGTPALSISFTAEVVFGGQVISTKPYTKTLNTDAESAADDFTFAKNTAYSFNVELPTPGEEIKFSITTVDNFGTGSDVTV